MLATTTSKRRPARSASGSTKVARRRRSRARWPRSRACACGSTSMPTTRAGAQRARGDREDAGAAAVVEHATRRRATCARSHSRHRRVVGCEPVPNARPGSRRRLSASGSRRLAPRRHDPEVVGDPDRPELRLRRAHPVLLGDGVGLVRRAAASATRADAARSAARRSAPAANSADERATPARARRAGSPGLAVQRRLAGGAGGGIGDVDRQRARVEQRVGPGVGVRRPAASKRSAT